MIRRKASTEDRRAAQLFLTPKGRRQLDEVRKLNDDLNTALREGFTAEELAVVVRFLSHVRSIPARAHAATTPAKKRKPARAT